MSFIKSGEKRWRDAASQGGVPWTAWFVCHTSTGGVVKKVGGSVLKTIQEGTRTVALHWTFPLYPKDG